MSVDGKSLIRRVTFRLVYGLLFAALCLSPHPRAVNVVSPQFATDEVLAGYPVVVVARWTEAPVVRHMLADEPIRYENAWGGGFVRVVRELEARTDVCVERVLKGRVEPGIHLVRLAWGTTAWEGDFGSDKLGIHVGRNIDRPNLWFLNLASSWDDPTRHFLLDTWTGIQPLELEPYFRALLSGDPRTEVPKLFEATEEEVVFRALAFVCGGELPWPYEPDRCIWPERRKNPRVEDAPAVKRLLERREPRIRRAAACVFAELAGKRCIPLMRNLLADDDSHIRGIAIDALCRHRDVESTGAICRAARGIEDGGIACKVVKELAEWGDERVVPAMIAFLQNDDLGRSYGKNDIGIPALNARAALREITGHVFPFDVQASLEAWQEVGDVADPAQRKALLAKLLPTDPSPIVAELVGGREEAVIEVRNRSKTRVFLTRPPTYVDFRARNAGSTSGFHDVTGKESFVRLAPGESMRLPVKILPSASRAPGEPMRLPVDIDSSFLASDPASRKVEITYTRNGNEFGLNAWIGVVEVKIGERWEPWNVQTVTKRWLNRKLRCRGELVNGKKHGKWTYWREDGAKEKEVTYFNGRLCSEAVFGRPPVSEDDR